MSAIPLAKPYDPKKLEYPVYVSEKLDGVPVRIDVTVKGDGAEYTVRSRQDKPVPSVDHLAKMLAHRAGLAFSSGVYTFVAEVTHRTFTDFKDISGAVRQHDRNDDLILNVFDFDLSYPERTQFEARMSFLKQYHNSVFDHEFIKLVHQQWCVNQLAVEDRYEWIMLSNPNAEGAVARSWNAEFKPGGRHWDYQKIVRDPSCDLRITGYDEAIDKYGKPKGMVGGLFAEYKGMTIGVGPGKLTHKERTNLWEAYTDCGMRIVTPPLAKIKYKRDPSYTALRQPTFQCWRDDKDEASYG